MLNEKPKKPKKEGKQTKWRAFRRVQGECWRRMVTPFLMYLFMSLLALACQAFTGGDTTPLSIVLGCVCIVAGAAYNAHLCYHYGKLHYGAYVAGCLHRKNEMFGIVSGGDHRPEREFRFWKGFYIGFLVGVPVILFGLLGLINDTANGWMDAILIMFAGWAYMPTKWFLDLRWGEEGGNLFPAGTPSWWSIVMIVLPVLVSGIFYLVGAYVEKHNRETGKGGTEETPKKKKS